MTNELDIKRVCLLMRSGVEVWLPEEKAEELIDDLTTSRVSGFIKLEGRLVNTVDISGIFNPVELDELRRRQRGMWKCKYNHWHTKSDNCECGRQH